MLLTTWTAPAVRAIRVAEPLCCTTLVLPSQVTTPCCTLKRNPSLPIFDLASLVRMAASIWASDGVWALWTAVGRVVAGLANAVPDRQTTNVRAARKHRMSSTPLVEVEPTACLSPTDLSDKFKARNPAP